MRRRAGRAVIAFVPYLAALVAFGIAAPALAGSDLQIAQNRSTAAKDKGGGKKSATVKRQPAWKFRRITGVPTLEYGFSDSETLISFSCQPEAGLIRVVSQIGSRGVRPGDGAAIRLTNGRNRYEIAGTAFSTESREAVDIGAATRIDAKLFALFRSGDTLTVDVPGRRQSLAVSAARPSAEAFERACRASTENVLAPTG